VQTEVERLFGEEVAHSCAAQLRRYYFVTTADHHGPICEQRALNSNILKSILSSEQKDPFLENNIIFSCENVSLNNDTFPRGLIFHARNTKGEVALHRLSFLPSNSHACSVYNFRPYTSVEVDKMQKLLREKVRDGAVPQLVADKISTLLEEVYRQPDILACTTFADQVSKTNLQLWKRMFWHSPAPLSNLLYIGQETIVIRLLTKYHLHHPKSILHHMLFDQKYDSLFMRYFDGLDATFTLAEKKGTYLFWAVSSDKNYRVQLWKRDGALVSDDGSVRVELTPESLQKALEEHRIVLEALEAISNGCLRIEGHTVKRTPLHSVNHQRSVP
jgi:hypothetical protein